MLVNCHMHAVLDGKNFKTSIDSHRTITKKDDSIIRNMLAAYRSLGITYLRDGGDRWDTCLRARALAHNYGIEYVAPGAPLFMKGNYGQFIGRSYTDFSSYKTLVDEMIERNVDFIKLMLSGILDFDHYGVVTGFSLERSLVFDLVAYAHDCGMPVMAHVNGARAIQDAVESGVDSIEHGFFSDEESRACLAQSKTVWVPTVAPFLNQVGLERSPDEVLSRIGEEQLSALRSVAKQGGLIALGDDAGAWSVPHGKGILDELGYMRQAFGDKTETILARGFKALHALFKPRCSIETA